MDAQEARQFESRLSNIEHAELTTKLPERQQSSSDETAAY
jgi:hypothetical protein